jgi:hypothetical protein
MIGIIGKLGDINPSVFRTTGQTFARITDIRYFIDSSAFKDFILGTKVVAF